MLADTKQVHLDVSAPYRYLHQFLTGSLKHFGICRQLKHLRKPVPCRLVFTNKIQHEFFLATQDFTATPQTMFDVDLALIIHTFS